ncbi:SH3 domain-containing protein [Myxococcota bacterium]|nr:SH3 domain-containing protein [Myxococcota bacterium]
MKIERPAPKPAVQPQAAPSATKNTQTTSQTTSTQNASTGPSPEQLRLDQQRQRLTNFQSTGQVNNLNGSPAQDQLRRQLENSLLRNKPATTALSTQDTPIAPTGSVSPTGPTTSPTEPQGEFLKTTDALNLRSVPTTQGNTPLTVIPNGATLQVTPDPVTGETRRDGFVHVTHNGQSGWVSEQYTQATTPPNPADIASVESASAHYINQFTAETQVGGDGRNANCGPTSTLIAMRSQGLEIPGIPGIEGNGTDGAAVQATRYHMYNGVDNNRDGVNADGTSYSLNGAGNENSTYTGFGGIERAVAAAGGTTAMINPATAENIATAIQNGQSVVISGNFLDSEGNVKTDTWAQGGGAKEHLVAITGMTADGNFIVCDPAHPSSAPIIATPEQVNSFMSGNAGAIAIDGP